jgi:hypothetical protein
MRWAMHVAYNGVEINAVRVIGGQQTAGRPRRKWEDNTRVDFK